MTFQMVTTLSRRNEKAKKEEKKRLDAKQDEDNERNGVENYGREIERNDEHKNLSK